jgi:hypothetical protein
MNQNMKEQIKEYILDTIVDEFDGAGLIITDEDLLTETIDDTNFEDYLANEIFKQDKVEKLLKVIHELEGLLISDLSAVEPWSKEIDNLFDAVKSLEEN